MTIEAPETMFVNCYWVACDGGGALCRPRKWMHTPTEPDRIKCPYCVCNCIHKDHQGLAFVSRDYHALPPEA